MFAHLQEELAARTPLIYAIEHSRNNALPSAQVRRILSVYVECSLVIA